MRYLLDTHVFLWYCCGNDRVSPVAKAIIEETTNQIFISIASVWEISIKNSLGKLNFDCPFEDFFHEQTKKNGFEILDLELRHIFCLNQLPFFHRDPFDRILIAQSYIENIPILSVDTFFDAYSIKRIW